MMIHLRRRSESTQTMLRRRGGGALVYRAWSDTVSLPELSIWDLFRYLGDHLTTICAPWTAPGQHCGHLVFPCPAKVPFGINLGEKSTQFRSMFLTQISITVTINSKSERLDNKQKPNRIPTPSHVFQSSLNTVKSKCFEGSAQVHLSGIGVTLEPCLE